MLESLSKNQINVHLHGNREIKIFRAFCNETSFGRKIGFLKDGLIYDLGMRVNHLVILAALMVVGTVSVLSLPIIYVISPESFDSATDKPSIVFKSFEEGLKLASDLLKSIIISPAYLGRLPKNENLEEAALTGDLESVNLALVYSKDKEITNHAIENALMGGHPSILKILMAEERLKTLNLSPHSIEKAFECRCIEGLKFIAEHPKIGNATKEKVLLCSAIHNCHELVGVILKNSSITDAALMDIFNLAVAYGSEDAVEVFLENPRVINHPKVNLCFATAGVNKHFHLLQTLLTKQKLDPAFQYEAIWNACLSGNFEFLSLLLSDARVRYSLENGPINITGLYHLVCDQKLWEVSKFLLQWVPVSKLVELCKLAAIKNNVEELEILLRAHPNSQVYDSAYKMAQSYNNIEAIELIEKIHPSLKSRLFFGLF